MTTLDRDTDFQEDDEEDFLGDDDAPYLIEGDIALPEVTWCTNRLQICNGCNINIIILVQDLDPRSRLAIDFMRHPAKKWPGNTGDSGDARRRILPGDVEADGQCKH